MVLIGATIAKSKERTLKLAYFPSKYANFVKINETTIETSYLGKNMKIFSRNNSFKT